MQSIPDSGIREFFACGPRNPGKLESEMQVRSYTDQDSGTMAWNSESKTVLACVAGVKRGRGRGEFGRERACGAREKERKGTPSSLLPPPSSLLPPPSSLPPRAWSRAWSRALTPYPFPFD